MKIAVLEQDRSQAELICQVLTAAGHSCQPFDSAKECLAQLRKENADMLIMEQEAARMDPLTEAANRLADSVDPVSGE